MKSIRPLPALLSAMLVFALAGCFGPKTTTTSKLSEREREEQEEHGRRHKKKGPQRFENKKLEKGEEEEENEEYDGIMAAQQREYDMTHDPATNNIPKERLLSALAQRNKSIAQQRSASNISINGTLAPYGTTYSVDAASWVERGSYTDAPGPFGNQRDSTAATSGRIKALLTDIDPTKPNQVFVGGIDGGLWSCPDITASAPAWTFIDNFSNLAISSICQDPTNPSTMYFGTGEHTFNADAVRGGGVWKSTDHGATWTMLANTATFYNVSKILCDKNGYVYVATVGSGAGLQRSMDRGTSWTTITPTINSLVTSRVGDMVYDSVNDRMGVYMGYYPQSLTTKVGYCYGRPSTVTSSTWSTPVDSASGLGMFISFNTSSTQLYQTILTVKNGVVWAMRSNYGTTALIMYRSMDGGATWTQQTGLASAAYGAGQGWYSIGMDCDPLNPGKNLIIGGLNVFKSVDSGKTFTQVSEWVKGNYALQTQYVHADVHNIYYNTSATQNRAIVVCDGGVFYSANGGANWADRNTGLRLKQFYSCAINPSVPDYYLAGAQDNGSHQFTQSGLGKSTEVTGGDGCFVAIDQLNPKNQFTSYVYNSYHVSTDGGNTWSSNTFGSSAGLFVNPFDFDSKTKKMYAAYTGGTYLRWDDPTTTQKTSSIVSVSSAIGANIPSAITVSTNLANTVYVAGGIVVAKVANAHTSTPTITALAPSLTAGSYISSVILGPSTTDQDMLVTSSTYGAKKVVVTADGGTTWTDITGNLPDMPVRWAMFYPGTNTQVYLATEAGIWYTKAVNGASTTWLPSVGFPAVRCDMIKYAATNGTIAVGTHGRGLWTTKYSTVPKVSFYNTLLNTSKAIGTSSFATCRTYADYSDTIQISDAPTGTATVTISAQAGTTARQGIDFDFTTNGSFTSPSSTVTFNNGTYPNKIPVTVRIYNNHDKNAVQPQTANLVYTISGLTDAVTSTANQSLAINLTDVFPNTTTLTSQTLWSENWESWPATSSVWNFVPEAYYGRPINAVAFVPYYSGCSGNVNTTTAQLLTTGATGAIAYCANAYSNTAYTALMYRAVNAYTNHNSNISVTFNYKSGANANITNALVFSADNGVTWDTLATYPARSSTTSTTFNITAAKPALNNTNFLLGWRSVGNASASYSAYGFGVDDIFVTGDVAAPPIDSTAGSAATNYENNGQSIDFFSANNNLFANVANPSADLGCVTATIETAGNVWQNYQNGHRSQKIILITPSTNSGSTYNATLYFTYAELAGMNVSSLRIAKTTAASLATSDGGNTVLVAPTTAVYSTYGVAFTGSFTGFSRFFLVDASVVLPITLVDFKAALINSNAELTWVTSSEHNNHQFDVEVSTDAANFVKLGTVLSKGNSNTDVTYGYTHVKPAAGTYYYRLKQIDIDGKFTYTKTIAITIGNGSIAKAFLYPIPAKQIVTLNFGTIVQQATISMYTVDMKLLSTETIGQATVTKDLNISLLPAGVYFLRVTTANKTETLRFVKD